MKPSAGTAGSGLPRVTPITGSGPPTVLTVASSRACSIDPPWSIRRSNCCISGRTAAAREPASAVKTAMSRSPVGEVAANPSA